MRPMRPLDLLSLAALAVTLSSLILAAGCSPRSAIPEHPVTSPTAAQEHALILQEFEGEHRVHRPPPGALSNLASPFIMKVDRRNGGSQDFVMFTEDIPPGKAISPHRHPRSEEIIFVHGGTGLATVGAARPLSQQARRSTCRATPS
ncbi:MAG: hypothetical protein M3065_21510 [Actinomycetota bacterium]|nr:hypothetical protein [Actinomycetota bacterium]